MMKKKHGDFSLHSLWLALPSYFVPIKMQEYHWIQSRALTDDATMLWFLISITQ